MIKRCGVLLFNSSSSPQMVWDRIWAVGGPAGAHETFRRGTSDSTWSCLPHITCKGAAIRCRCSCKAYLELSPTISINTVEQRKDNWTFHAAWTLICRKLSWTDLPGKRCCEALGRPPVLGESKQRQHSLRYQSAHTCWDHHHHHHKCRPDLLRDFKADVGTQSEHVLHLLRCGRDQRDVQGVVAVLQVLQMIVKLGLTGVFYTCRSGDVFND